MAKPSVYKSVSTTNIQDALSFVSFPIKTYKDFFRDEDGKEHPTGRVVMVRTDTMHPFEVLSKQYAPRKHEEVLEQVNAGIMSAGIPVTLKEVSLDKNGAKMMARYQFQKDYPIGRGIDSKKGIDLLRPELTVINSYDGSLGVGFDMGSERLVCLNLACAILPDIRARWMHFGKSVDLNKIAAQTHQAIEKFEKVIIPEYRVLAENEITLPLARKAVALAVDKDIVPQKLARFVKHCVEDPRALEKEAGLKRSAWTLMNAMTWATTHKFEASPTRARETRIEIAKAFQGGAKKFLRAASELDEKFVTETLEKIA